MKRYPNTKWIFPVISTLLALAISICCVVIYKGNATVELTPRETHPVSVSVEGEVALPGVYTLPQGSRMRDAIRAAGGMTDIADEASLNLAAYLEDGEQIHVDPKETRSMPVAESVAPEEEAPQITRQAVPTQVHVNINTATADQLTALPGIGPVKAQHIVEYRQSIGRFTSVDQLINVNGIGEKTLANIRNLVEL